MKQMTRVLIVWVGAALALALGTASAEGTRAEPAESEQQAGIVVAALAPKPDTEAKEGEHEDLVLRGDAECTRCHDQDDEYPVLAISKTRHGVRADARTPTCTSCHGESKNHIENENPDKTGDDDDERMKPDVVFKRLTGITSGEVKNETTSAQVQNEACLACHQSGSRVHWQGSGHDLSQLACSSCHTVHAARDQVLVAATQAGVCFSCHTDKRADMFRFSTHPLRTGWMSCSSCHAPHGSTASASLTRNSINETCYECHAEKRGPFLWEHSPVRENCAECHNPHGSNNSAMLKARGPYLCQQCHMASGHPGGTLYSGNNLPPLRIGAVPATATPTYQRMLGTQCVNCHVTIHGSNHPSGALFNR